MLSQYIHILLIDPHTEGTIFCPLPHDINEANELTTHMKSVRPHNEMLKYDEFVFKDPAERRYKAKDFG